MRQKENVGRVYNFWIIALMSACDSHGPFTFCGVRKWGRGDTKLAMFMREIFSENLRRLCAAQQSHAHVARELGVNRQQFYSYIKGKNLPNERVIEKICEYFEVDVGTLFRQYDPISDFSSIDALNDKHKKQLNRIIADETGSKQRGIADGLYYIYFSMANDPDIFICSLLAIRREGGLTTFKRISRYVDPLAALRPSQRGIHSGVIFFRESLLFFLGLDQVTPGTPSMLVARPMVSAEILYGGQAIVHSGPTFQIVKFCIALAPKRVKIWRAIKKVKIMSIYELSEISPTIMEFLHK